MSDPDSVSDPNTSQQAQFKHVSVPVLSREDKQLPPGQRDTDWARNATPMESGWEDGPGSPAVCLRAGSHAERPNGLIGVSGNVRCLTRDISPTWMKRLEAEREREGEGWRNIMLFVKQDPLGALSFCITPPPRCPLTSSQLLLSQPTTQTQSAKWVVSNNDL